MVQESNIPSMIPKIEDDIPKIKYLENTSRKCMPMAFDIPIRDLCSCTIRDKEANITIIAMITNRTEKDLFK